MSDYSSWRLSYHIDHLSDPAQALDRQRYYWQGFEQLLGDQSKIYPWRSRFFAWLREHEMPGSSRFWRKAMKRRVPANFKAPKNHVGRYVFSDDQGTDVRVVIDTADGPEITDEASRQWADIYFKANCWQGRSYPHNVRPIVNGNGKLHYVHLARLRRLREQEKSYDVVYWSKIWQVGDEHRREQTLEHNIRLFECLAAAEGHNSLLCILPDRDKPGEFDDCKRRLDRCGVPHQVGWGEISTDKFHDAYAQARMAFLRPGDHLCISWKMIDFLALGTCVVYDGAPIPQWPAPLLEGQHWINGACGLDADYNLPEDSAYAQLTQRVSELVQNPTLQSHVMAENARYYAQHAAPEAIAQYVMAEVLECARNKAPEPSPMQQPI